MSSVTVLQAPSLQTAKISSPSCQQCGADIPYATVSAAAEDARRRISELEAQVRILTGKATAAGTHDASSRSLSLVPCLSLLEQYQIQHA